MKIEQWEQETNNHFAQKQGVLFAGKITMQLLSPQNNKRIASQEVEREPHIAASALIVKDVNQIFHRVLKVNYAD